VVFMALLEGFVVRGWDGVVRHVREEVCVNGDGVSLRVVQYHGVALDALHREACARVVALERNLDHDGVAPAELSDALTCDGTFEYLPLCVVVKEEGH
jgi:hypothetical protein